MKDKLKDPNLYYILVPVIAGVWAVLAGLVFYPKSVKAWEDPKNGAKAEYKQAQDLLQKIIEKKPEILKERLTTDKKGEVDLGQAIDTLCLLFEIPTSKYRHSVRKPITRAGKKSRTATMTIKEVGIGKIGGFVSAMLSLSPGLDCEVISIDKAKTGKDNWNVDLTMKYTY
ncbi:MAG: hypothetical protein ACYSUT_00520 [Planctomycetota bacterium]|jgi:hypothetical protein